MAVKDFMSKKVVYVSPETTVASVADLMREQKLRRLPVMENDRLVGLITEGAMADASPSKATSLSIYEMNYLLNKTRVADIMVRDLITVSRYASLEDAIYLMMTHSVGILPVVDNGQLYGVITDKDIYRAFLQVSGYGEEGVRINLKAEDKVGILENIIKVISAQNINIKRTLIAGRSSGETVIEIKIDGKADIDKLRQILDLDGVTIEDIQETKAKAGI